MDLFFDAKKLSPIFQSHTHVHIHTQTPAHTHTHTHFRSVHLCEPKVVIKKQQHRRKAFTLISWHTVCVARKHLNLVTLELRNGACPPPPLDRRWWGGEGGLIKRRMGQKQDGADINVCARGVRNSGRRD